MRPSNRSTLVSSAMSDPAVKDPETKAPAWHARAACKGLDAAVFYPAEDDGEAIEAAKAVCAQCPVNGPCLEYALDVREKNGVWGGCTERDRRRIIRQRRRSA